MRHMTTLALAITMTVLASASNAEPVSDKRGLTLDGAKKVIAATIAEAKRVNAPGGSDRGGRRRR